MIRMEVSWATGLWLYTLKSWKLKVETKVQNFEAPNQLNNNPAVALNQLNNNPADNAILKRDQLFIVMEILTPVFLGSREKPEVSKEGAKMHPGYVINLEFSQIWPEW